MDRSRIAALYAGAISGLQSFFVRVALIAAVLAIPILGTSYVLVSSLSSDISMATAEHATLQNFDRIADLFALLERLHDGISDGDAAGIRAAGVAVDRALIQTQAAYERSGADPAHQAIWNRLHAEFARLRRDATIANADAVLAELKNAGNELESNTPLDLDPSSSVQYISDVIMRREPHAIVAIGQTADAAVTPGNLRLEVHAAERIASRHALEQQAIADVFQNLNYATTLDPTLEPTFVNRVGIARTTTSAYERRIDTLLATLERNPGENRAIEMATRLALDAHFQLWRLARTQADRLVLERLERQLGRRRIVVSFALLAVLVGALAVTLVSRYEARRDRIELASAKLEREKLRVELSRLSIERALRLQEAQLRAIFENADLGIAIFDRHGDVLQYNAAVMEILGSATHDILDDQRDAVVAFESTLEGRFTRDTSRISENGKTQWLSLTFSAVFDEGVCQLVILLIRDATEETLLAQQLAHDANHDSLTGLANRAAFERALSTLLAADAAQPAFALMYIDLDSFKPINDTFGHRAGDSVLVTVAERLRGAVGGQDLCGRLGGDEFAILIHGVNEVSTLETIARRIASAVAKVIIYHDTIELRVTASIGIAIGSAHYRSTDEIKHDADLALYAVKERGRNGHLIYRRPLTLT